MSAPVPDRVDVVVVGAGPVGCALSLLLGARGRSVLLVERHTGPYPLPRAVHFDDETARILQACGLGGDLPALSEPATTYEWRNGEGVPLLRFEMPAQGRQGWPSANMFNQPDLEARLFDRVEATEGLSLLWGHTAVDAGQDGDSAWVEIEPADGSARTRIDASYVVGCDGANSTVRDRLGVTFDDRGFYYDWLVVDVALHEPRVFDPPNLQVCDPRRPTTVVSGGPGRRRWEFMCLPGESLETLDEEAAAWAFLESWDVRPDNATMVRHAGYRFRARWATRWHEGRIFVAGDAAHQTPPFAGQGMCAGLRDAANLAWKIDFALDHPEATALLETYDTERIPQAAAVIEVATELGRVICIPDTAEARTRDEQMAPLVPPGGSTPAPPMPGISGGILADSAMSGELFIQATVRAGDAEGRLDDVIGTGWHLVTSGEPTELDGELASWFESIGGRQVAIGTSVEDVDGRYSRWFADHGVAAVLERPDFAIYGTAPTERDVPELVTRLRNQLEASQEAPVAS
ncbi:MAG: bifunctional 3-(3-hydroxy-phenyl)propionate/3-hydroxycinnamic acid hydroxylase [Acidimicrobiales bacterium]